MSISCFGVGLDPILKIFKNLLDRSSGCFNPRVFQRSQISDFRNLENSRNIIFEKWLRFFLVFLSILVSPKSRIIGLEVMDMSTKSGKHINDGFSMFPKTNPKSYCSKMKQNNYTELWGDSFQNMFNKSDPLIPGCRGGSRYL